MANIGGMQDAATSLFEALQDDDSVEVTPLVLRTSWRWTHVKVVPFLIWSLVRIYWLVMRGKIDVILFTSIVTAVLAVPLRPLLKRKKVPTISVAHGRDVTLAVKAHQFIVPYVLRSLSAVIAVSRATASACVERGMPEDAIYVIHNGTKHPPEPKVSAEVESARRRLSEAVGFLVKPDAFVLCSVGRLVERKGYDWFITQVLPRLSSKAVYFLAGEGPHDSTIRDAVLQSGLGDRVHLLGKVSSETREALYRASDLFIMCNRFIPGDMEGLGMAMLEAGQRGVPSIANDLEGIRDAVDDNVSGHLVKTGDAQAFAAKISHYMAHPNELRALSERTQAHVGRKFAWDVILKAYLEAISEVVERTLRL